MPDPRGARAVRVFGTSLVAVVGPYPVAADTQRVDSIQSGPRVHPIQRPWIVFGVVHVAGRPTMLSRSALAIPSLRSTKTRWFGLMDDSTSFAGTEFVAAWPPKMGAGRAAFMRTGPKPVAISSRLESTVSMHAFDWGLPRKVNAQKRIRWGRSLGRFDYRQVGGNASGETVPGRNSRHRCSRLMIAL